MYLFQNTHAQAHTQIFTIPDPNEGPDRNEHFEKLSQWFWRTPCCSLVTNLCLTFCYPMDYSLPGSSVFGISQERIQEWVATSFSRASSRPMG